jgi:hypothetical protein
MVDEFRRKSNGVSNKYKMRNKFCSQNLMEAFHKHGLAYYEDNRIYVEGTGCSGVQYVVVMKEIVVNCCEYCEELSDSVNDLEIIDHVKERQLLKKGSAFWALL